MKAMRIKFGRERHTSGRLAQHHSICTSLCIRKSRGIIRHTRTWTGNDEGAERAYSGCPQTPEPPRKAEQHGQVKDGFKLVIGRGDTYSHSDRRSNEYTYDRADTTHALVSTTHLREHCTIRYTVVKDVAVKCAFWRGIARRHAHTVQTETCTNKQALRACSEAVKAHFHIHRQEIKLWTKGDRQILSGRGQGGGDVDVPVWYVPTYWKHQ